MMIFGRRPKKPRLTAAELADQLERLLAAQGWTEREIEDELACVPIGDIELDRIREYAIRLSRDFGAAGGTTYFSLEDKPRIKRLIHSLRQPPHIAAHDNSIRHRAEIERSDVCGCFHCCATFRPDEISDWVDDDDAGRGQTALCPRCGIDSVIGDASPFPITDELLSRMRSHWF